MRRFFLLRLAPAILLAAAVHTSAAGDVSVGEPAPEISVADWLNAPPLSLARLRGKVVVVEFWATWCGPCRTTIPHLVGLHEKYRAKGVVIMGLTDEPKSRVEAFARQMGMTYAVGCGSPSSGTYGVRGIPHAFVVDVAGRVVWRGHPAGIGLEKAIEEQLRTNPPTLLSPKEKAEAMALLEKVQKALGEKNYAEAAGLARQIREPDRDTEVGRRVAAVREQLTAQAEARFAEAETRIEQKAYYEADGALQEVAVLVPGSDLVSKAKARRAELLKKEDIRAAIERGRREHQAAEALATLEKDAEDMDPAALLKAYEALATKHAGTEAGRTAASKARAMRSDKTLMAGINSQAAERDCKGWLSMARNFINAGMNDKARPYLVKVVEKYPATDFAEQAKEMLEAIEK